MVEMYLSEHVEYEPEHIAAKHGHQGLCRWHPSVHVPSAQLDRSGQGVARVCLTGCSASDPD